MHAPPVSGARILKWCLIAAVVTAIGYGVTDRFAEKPWVDTCREPRPLPFPLMRVHFMAYLETEIEIVVDAALDPARSEAERRVAAARLAFLKLEWNDWEFRTRPPVPPCTRVCL